MEKSNVLSAYQYKYKFTFYLFTMENCTIHTKFFSCDYFNLNKKLI